MYKNRRILTVCPARGGSKGIPLKNLLRIGGKTLIQHVAEFVLSCEFVDAAVVSTDHMGIIEEAKSVGLSVPFVRPKELAGDCVGDLPVLVHALKESETAFNQKFDIVLMLQPTCPFRNPEQIKKTLDHLIDHSFDSVWTVSETDSKAHPLKQLRFEFGHLSFYEEGGGDIVARQQLATVYHRNGVAYAFTRDCLLEKKRLLTENSSAVVTNEFYVNIDTWEDVKLAQLYLDGQIGHAPEV